MTAAAIKATFADWRTVKSRKMLQLIFEVPLETQAEVLTTLGAPMPDRDIWVAVARLNPMTESEVMPAGRGSTEIDTPPSSQTLGAGAQGSSVAPIGNPGPIGAAGNPVAPEGDENRGTCPTCHGEKRILHIYDRPGGPPGNQWIDCPDCTGARAVKRAGILCKDPEFQRFAGAHDITIKNQPPIAEGFAAGFLRTRCQIASRRDLAIDERAREAFEALVTEYDLWRGRIAEQRG